MGGHVKGGVPIDAPPPSPQGRVGGGGIRPGILSGMFSKRLDYSGKFIRRRSRQPLVNTRRLMRSSGENRRPTLASELVGSVLVRWGTLSEWMALRWGIHAAQEVFETRVPRALPYNALLVQRSHCPGVAGRSVSDKPTSQAESWNTSHGASSIRKQSSPAHAKGPDFIRPIPWLTGIEGSVSA